MKNIKSSSVHSTILSTAQIVAIVSGTVIGVAAIAVGVLYALGIISFSSSTPTTTKISPTAGRSVAPSTQGGVTVTVTSSPVDKSQTLSVSKVVPGPVNDSYASAFIITETYSSAFASNPTLDLTTLTSSLMNQSVTYTMSSSSATGFQLQLTAVNGTTTPTVGYNTNISATLNSSPYFGTANYGGLNISIGTGQNNVPVVAFGSPSGGSSGSTYAFAPNSSGTSTTGWTSRQVAIVAGSSSNFAGSALWRDSSNSTYFFVPLYNATSGNLLRTDTTFQTLSTNITFNGGIFTVNQAPIGGFNLNSGFPAFFTNSFNGTTFNVFLSSTATPTSSSDISVFTLGSAVLTGCAAMINTSGANYMAVALCTSSSITFFISNNLVPSASTFTLSSVITTNSTFLSSNLLQIKLLIATVNGVTTPVLIWSNSSSLVYMSVGSGFSTTASGGILQTLAVNWSTPTLIVSSATTAFDCMISSTSSNVGLVYIQSSKLFYMLIPVSNPTGRSLSYLGNQLVGRNVGCGLVNGVPAVAFTDDNNTVVRFLLSSATNEAFMEGVNLSYVASGLKP